MSDDTRPKTFKTVCSFCGATKDDCAVMFANDKAAICSECIMDMVDDVKAQYDRISNTQHYNTYTH